MKIHAGIKSVAASLPRGVRTNDYYRDRYPESVAAIAEKSLGKLWAKGAQADAFSTEMAPYLDDPFRGSVERRILAPGETALSLELAAARDALAAANMSAGDVDLVIVSSFQPDQLGVGNAAFLARELGVARPAWNLESACASSLVALHTACALVESGRYRNVLVVASCAYSRSADEADSVSWFLGDGAGAFVVGQVKERSGLLGMHTLPTTETCDTFYYRLDADPGAAPRMVMKCTPSSGRILHETAERHLVTCCAGAASAAGVKLADIDFLVCNTPTAWFAAFAARALQIDPKRTISSFAKTGNIGCALLPVNLHAAASTGRLKVGDLVLLYSMGSVATASAAVLRWDGAAFGPTPA
jgi:3-oxoacyl-[acyl-carrier-protein] synthase III